MRTVLRLLGTRYGIALILVVLVVGVLAVARTFVSDRTPETNGAIGPTVGPVSPSIVNPEPTFDDDGILDTTSAAPSLSAGAADATTIATRFVTAWLRRPGVTAEQWRASLTPHATPELMQSLQNSDPASVPATKIVGSVQMQPVGGDIEATVLADGGTVRLMLAIVKGRWLVRSLDWEAA